MQTNKCENPVFKLFVKTLSLENDLPIWDIGFSLFCKLMKLYSEHINCEQVATLGRSLCIVLLVITESPDYAALMLNFNQVRNHDLNTVKPVNVDT